jgi:hypothetical protein
MVDRQTVLAVAVLAAVVLLLLEGSAFGSVSANRDLRVDVAPDSEAYFGIESGCDGDGDLNVKATNRISETPLEVTLSVNGTSKSISDLGFGETATRTFAANASAPDDRIAVRATASTVAVQLTRPVPDAC